MKTTMMQVIETSYELGGFDEQRFDELYLSFRAYRPYLADVHSYVKDLPGRPYVANFGIYEFHAYPKPGGLWDVAFGKNRKYNLTDAEAAKTIISSAWFADIKAAIKALQPCA